MLGEIRKSSGTSSERGDLRIPEGQRQPEKILSTREPDIVMRERDEALGIHVKTMRLLEIEKSGGK